MRIKYKFKDERKILIPTGHRGIIVRFNKEAKPDPEKFDKVLNTLQSMGYAWHATVSPDSVQEEYRPIATGLGIRDWHYERFDIVWSDEGTYDESGFITIGYEDFMKNKYKFFKVKKDEDSL